MRGRIGSKAQIIDELKEHAKGLIANGKPEKAVEMLSDALEASCKARSLREWFMYCLDEFLVKEEEE